MRETFGGKRKSIVYSGRKRTLIIFLIYATVTPSFSKNCWGISSRSGRMVNVNDAKNKKNY